MSGSDEIPTVIQIPELEELPDATEAEAGEDKRALRHAELLASECSRPRLDIWSGEVI